MRKDDDIAASLPRPPPAAPARREAAIAAALRRFDGEGPAVAAGAAGPGPWRWRVGRPYAGALAGAFLVALIALPLAWTSIPDRARDGGRGRRAEPAAKMAESGSVTADASPARPVPASPLPRGPEPAAEKPVPEAPAPTAPPPPAAAKASQAEPVASEEALADAAGTREIIVTGSRIRRPNLESSVPVTVVGGENIAAGGSRSSRAARRGDWNACTIEDPDPAACRKPAPGRAAGEIAEGLARAREGDVDRAIAAFDRAIEIAPRSALAYLNRGLAHRRRGDLEGALADLDRAVRFSPRAARGYYHRGLVLRQLGDLRRARADEARAVELDPRYAAVVRGD
jgi:tetratricopeptide (TPR) repeat protein